MAREGALGTPRGVFLSWVHERTDGRGAGCGVPRTESCGTGRVARPGRGLCTGKRGPGEVSLEWSGFDPRVVVEEVGMTHWEGESQWGVEPHEHPQCVLRVLPCAHASSVQDECAWLTHPLYHKPLHLKVAKRFLCQQRAWTCFLAKFAFFWKGEGIV